MPPSQPPEALVEVHLPARLENLPQFIVPILAVAKKAGVPESRLGDLELALEESLVNIIDHAYQGKTGEIGVFCLDSGGRLITRIEDEGSAFSVTDAAPPDLTSDLMSRKIGGLGIHLVRSLMDEVGYRREEGRNTLELIVFL
jgi:serine/threonine-protein kinase RsbW